jgi:catechol 2,3-dioxygenase-like lactoylglutathione lyase family enzyme
MKPGISLITIGVDDLERSLRFYRDGLGLKTEGIVGTQFEHAAVAFFDLVTRALGSPSPTEFTIGHNVSSKAEVDTLLCSQGIPLKACPGLGTPATPRQPRLTIVRMLPSAGSTGSAFATI